MSITRGLLVTASRGTGRCRGGRPSNLSASGQGQPAWLHSRFLSNMDCLALPTGRKGRLRAARVGRLRGARNGMAPARARGGGAGSSP